MVTLWAAGSAVAVGVLTDYSADPCAPATPPPVWPVDAGLARATEANLLFFVHPACPCTRAAAEELARVVMTVGPRVRCQAIVISDVAHPEWEHASAVDFIRQIPSVTVVPDPDRAITRTFGVRTSGQALLYRSDGGLLFSGGITPGRGHAGPNLGEANLLQAIEAETATVTSGPVFGCAMLDATSGPTAACETRP